MDMAKNLRDLIIDAINNVNRGIKFGDKDYFKKSLLGFEKFNSIVPNFHDCLINHGVALSYLNKYELALEKFNSAIKIEKDFYGFYNRGLVNENLKLYNPAIKDFNSAIKLNPKSFRPYFRIGIIEATQNKNYLSAIDWFRKAIKLNPKDKIILDNIKIAKKNIESSLDKLN